MKLVSYLIVYQISVIYLWSFIYGRLFMVVYLWLALLRNEFGHLIFYFKFYFKTNGNFIILKKFTVVILLNLMA